MKAGKILIKQNKSRTDEGSWIEKCIHQNK